MNGHAKRVGEDFAKKVRLALAHQAVIDVDADESIADRAMDERCSDGGVDPA